MLLALGAMPSASADAAKVTLGWDANTEPDLEGYVVYRNADDPGPPYDHVDELPEDELANPLQPEATLTGLGEGKEYHIALTAYNTEGVESSFSNDLCIEVVDGAAQLCSQSTTPGTSTSLGRGGGSGGGCFIETAGAQAFTFSQWVARPVARSQVLAMLFLLLVLIAATRLGLNKTDYKKER